MVNTLNTVFSLVSVLVEKYYRLLITECEIFLSLIVKFLDPDKPSWQRALALELLHKLVTQVTLQPLIGQYPQYSLLIG